MTHQTDHESTAGKAAVLRDFVRQLTDRLADCCTECDACAVIARDLADAALRRMADETPHTQTTFVPPAHYRRDDGVDCCVHTTPVGPDSCPACRELADADRPTPGPTPLDEAVAALQAKATALSAEAEEEMRSDLEDRAQVWHEAAELARRAGRKAARRTQPAAGARQDGDQTS